MTEHEGVLLPQVARLIRKERLPEVSLCQVAREVINGTLGVGEADLGGGLFKKRVARSGRGKSGGYRVIVAYRPPQAERVLFSYAFAKNASSSVTRQGHEALAKVAEAFVETDDREVAALLANGSLKEVACDADPEN